MNSLITIANELGAALAAAAQRLMHLSWQGSALILVVALITIAWRRGPACFKYGLWCLVLVKLLLPVSFSLPSGAVNIIPDLPVNVGPAPSPAMITIETAPAFNWTLMSWLGLVWLVGVLVMLGLLFARFRTVRTWLMRSSSPAPAELIELANELSVRMGVRRMIPIWTTHAINGPLVIGPLNPQIFLPEDLFAKLEPQERAMLLAHELAHIKRRDTFVAAVEMIALAVHWFNPLAWMMMAAVRTQRELACDDRVVALFNDRAADYGSGLLKVARFQQGLKGSAFGMAALGEGGSTIGLRIRNILNQRRRPIAFLSIPAILMLALAACVILPNHAKHKIEREVIYFSEEGQREEVHQLLRSGVLQQAVWGQVTPPTPDAAFNIFDEMDALIVSGTKEHIHRTKKYLDSKGPQIKAELDTRTYKVPYGDISKLLLVQSFMKANDEKPPAKGRHFSLKNDELMVRDTPERLARIDELLGNQTFTPKPFSKNLHIATFSFVPENNGKLSDEIKSRIFKEIRKQIHGGATERGERGHNLWFDANDHLTVIDSPANIEKIRLFINSIPELKRESEDITGGASVVKSAQMPELVNGEISLVHFDLTPSDPNVNPEQWKQFVSDALDAVTAYLKSPEAVKLGVDGRRFWYDDQTKRLSVEDTPANIERVRKYLESLPEFNDQPVGSAPSNAPATHIRGTRVYVFGTEDPGETVGKILPSPHRMVFTGTVEGVGKVLVVEDTTENLDEIEHTLLKGRLQIKDPPAIPSSTPAPAAAAPGLVIQKMLFDKLNYGRDGNSILEGVHIEADPFTCDADRIEIDKASGKMTLSGNARVNQRKPDGLQVVEGEVITIDLNDPQHPAITVKGGRPSVKINRTPDAPSPKAELIFDQIRWEKDYVKKPDGGFSCAGNVIIKSSNITFTGDSADFDKKTNTLTITGNAVANQRTPTKRAEIKGDQIHYRPGDDSRGSLWVNTLPGSTRQPTYMEYYDADTSKSL